MGAAARWPSALAGTFVVTSTGDSADSSTADGVCNDGTGACTLRAAIEQANASAGADAVHFAIASGAQTIAPASELPHVTGTLTIDGTTQPGFTGTPIVEIDGVGAGGAFPTGLDGLTITASNSVVRGLLINRFTREGIMVAANSVPIEGNYIGTDTTGDLDRGTWGAECSWEQQRHRRDDRRGSEHHLG